MIYILSVIACVTLAIAYDIVGYQKNKQLWYHILLLWFILVSGLQYGLGSDIFVYSSLYKSFSTSSFKLSDLGYYMDNQMQPGWILLVYLSKLITDDFLLIKVIQAVFINIALFSFFKKESQYIFLCVLIYALFSYLVLNFNVFRHSFAIGFALYGFSYLRRKEYVKYFVFIFLAWLFHSTAIILVIIPVFHLLLKYNKWTLITVVALIIVLIGYMNSDNLTNLLFSIVEKGYLGEDLSSLGSVYLSSERQGAHDSFSIFSLRRLIVILVIGYYIFKKKDLFMGTLGIMYLLFCVLAGFMQALWRFRLYFDPFYYIVLAEVIAELPKNYFKQTFIAYFIAFSLLLYFPIRDILNPLPGTKWRGIDQYYPYHSIFDPKINHEQKSYFERL